MPSESKATPKEDWVDVIVTEADGSRRKGKIIPVAKFDMNRPGILSDGTAFEGNGAQVPQVNKNGQPVEVITRAVPINITSMGKTFARMIPCADVIVNCGMGKGGPVERIKFGVFEKKNVPIGGAVPPVCYYEIVENNQGDSNAAIPTESEVELKGKRAAK